MPASLALTTRAREALWEIQPAHLAPFPLAGEMLAHSTQPHFQLDAVRLAVLACSHWLPILARYRQAVRMRVPPPCAETTPPTPAPTPTPSSPPPRTRCCRRSRRWGGRCGRWGRHRWRRPAPCRPIPGCCARYSSAPAPAGKTSSYLIILWQTQWFRVACPNDRHGAPGLEPLFSSKLCPANFAQTLAAFSASRSLPPPPNP